MQSLAPAPTNSLHSPSQDVVTEQLLREQLLSQVSTSNGARDPHEMQTSSPASPNDPNPLDHTMPGSGVMSTSAGSDDGNDNDGRKGYGKRELSTSKRAAQNRAAQRAFRQRKEGYIKKLEEQVRDHNLLNENYKAIQAENYQLRDYIINLQSRLIESQGDFPQPPSNIDGLRPGNVGQQPQQHGGVGNIAPLDQLRVAAQLQRSSQVSLHTLEGVSYRPSNSPGVNRMKTEDREMTAAQQALQGRTDG